MAEEQAGFTINKTTLVAVIIAVFSGGGFTANTMMASAAPDVLTKQDLVEAMQMRDDVDLVRREALEARLHNMEGQLDALQEKLDEVADCCRER